MADEVDDAAVINELLDGIKIREIRAAANRREVLPTGQCHNCDHVFDGEDKAERLYCDDECRDDWTKREAAKARR
jgi:hypothetical protein